MPIFIFDKSTRRFSLMVVSSYIYPLSDNVLIIRDNLAIEYQLVFENHGEIQEFMTTLYKQRYAYVYCDCYLYERENPTYADTQDREIDPNRDMEMELDK